MLPLFHLEGHKKVRIAVTFFVQTFPNQNYFLSTLRHNQDKVRPGASRLRSASHKGQNSWGCRLEKLSRLYLSSNKTVSFGSSGEIVEITRNPRTAII